MEVDGDTATPLIGQPGRVIADERAPPHANAHSALHTLSVENYQVLALIFNLSRSPDFISSKLFYSFGLLCCFFISKFACREDNSVFSLFRDLNFFLFTEMQSTYPAPAASNEASSEGGYVLYPANHSLSVGANSQSLAYVNIGPCHELVPVNINTATQYNGFEEHQQQLYSNTNPVTTFAAAASNIASSNAITTANHSYYGLINGTNIPQSSNNFYPDSHLPINTASTAHLMPYFHGLLPPHCVYAQSIPTPMFVAHRHPQQPSFQLAAAAAVPPTKGHLTETNVNLEPCGPERRTPFYSRLWTGELQPPANLKTDYLCRFQIEPDRFNELKRDLMQLFRTNIHINDTFPPENSASPYSLYTYFKEAHFKDFLQYCEPNDDQMAVQNFVHPDKGYKLEVRVKPFSLPDDLKYRNKSRFPTDSPQQFQHLLYVDGLDGLLIAKDLCKIYNDLYNNVYSARVFTDKNMRPHKSAVISFKSLCSFEKALRESPILVKTLTFTALLRNKVFNKKYPHRYQHNHDSLYNQYYYRSKQMAMSHRPSVSEPSFRNRR